MDNTFIECMVKREDKNLRIMKKVGMIVGVLLMDLLVLLFFPNFISIGLVVSFLIFFFFWRKIDKEYEMIYTDGLLDFDVIYHRSMRKRLLSVDAKEFEFIAPAESQNWKKAIEAQRDKVLNCSSTVQPNAKCYVGVVKKNEKMYKVIFEPNQRIVDALRRYIPNKFEMRK